ncbi:MAG: fibrobacter succinogenes major paralogous domain-containing protein [Fibrobacter sp.]|nr:fibrobacter succinogenes major paralogous domain-containing protein [Fibrobacter sp.]
MKYFATLLISAVLFVACSGESSDPTAPDSNGKMSSSSVESGSNLVKSSSSITSGASSSSVPLWDVNVSSSYIESSNSLVNSSSSEQSSSSVTLATPCKTEMEDNCEYGELLDDRDGQIYKTVKIGDQVWMAENLNFKADSSCCYNSVDSNCTKYGRLYMWAAAVGKPESECGYDYTCSLPSGNIQGVCPSGWHLPSTTEWETLSNAVGEQFTAGGVLKSTSGWMNSDWSISGDGTVIYTSGNGTDAFGFSALPAGYRNYLGEFSREGECAFFWNSTEYALGYADDMCLCYDFDNARLSYVGKINMFSVRCLKDAP